MILIVIRMPIPGYMWQKDASFNAPGYTPQVSAG